MPRTRIKICGICRPEDARDAAAFGADAIGIVMHSGLPRTVRGAEARQILRAVPSFVTPVLLFVNDQPMFVKSTAEGLGVNHVQLHGAEDAAAVQHLKPLRVIKAVRVTPTLADDLARWKAAIEKFDLWNLVGIVLETATTAPGGTGIANDWETVVQHQQAGNFTGLPALITAGGLTPETVGDVVRSVHPFAVDVSTGVESSKRTKDATQIQSFINSVRAADRATQ